METQRAKIEAWLQGRGGARDPQLEGTLLAVAEAYDRVKETGKLEAEQLRLIVEGAASAQVAIWETCVHLLGNLSAEWPEAAGAVLAMSTNRKAQVRFNGLCCLTSGTPAAIVKTMLKAGLVDKSSKVRWKAAAVIDKLGLVDLLPNLAAALAAEQDAKTKSTLEYHLLLLRDGYILQPGPGGISQVTARIPRGSITRGVTADELRAKGIAAIVSELQDRGRAFPGVE